MIERDRRQLLRSMFLHLSLVSVEFNHAIARACIAVAHQSSPHLSVAAFIPAARHALEAIAGPSDWLRRFVATAGTAGHPTVTSAMKSAMVRSSDFAWSRPVDAQNDDLHRLACRHWNRCGGRRIAPARVSRQRRCDDS